VLVLVLVLVRVVMVVAVRVVVIVDVTVVRMIMGVRVVEVGHPRPGVVGAAAGRAHVTPPPLV
jgi:hypothetical protein